MKIIHGDCIEAMRDMDENTVDAVVTDPPYGLTSIVERFGKPGSVPAKHGTDGVFARSSKGFMGKEWDGSGIEYNPEMWGQVYRVMKPGAHLLAFGGTRTYHRLACAIEDAGFEIRDMVVWHYGSGFPKSLNIGDGKGTALKPATEPICLARKPLSEKTVVANVLRWGTGALNVDASRIGENAGWSYPKGAGGSEAHHMERGQPKGDGKKAQSATVGRWPANLILDPEAARMLDEQSGESKDGTAVQRNRDESVHNKVYGARKVLKTGDVSYGGTGGASRFFYIAKPSKWEKTQGVSGKQDHPTVKPVALMRYLISMVTPLGGTVLDPFLGSGTTLCALATLKVEGANFSGVGIEKESEYVEIAKARVAWYEQHADKWRAFDRGEDPVKVDTETLPLFG